MKKIKLYLVGLFLAFTITAGFSQEKKAAEEYQFINKIVLESTPVKNQQHTGTCWSYCTTSFIESELIRMGKPQIDLSEMYNVRMNYVEKSLNYFLRQGKCQFSEGGLSHDVMNSIAKYGLVPESAYSGNAANSGIHNHEEMAGVLKSTLKTVIGNKKAVTPYWMGNIEGTLNNYMGTPPTEFEYEGKKYTPQSFTEFLDFHPEDYTTFTSFSHVPFYSLYVLQVPDNWSNGTFRNVPLDDLMTIIDQALENGFTIAWDADVSEKSWSRKHSIAVMPEVSYKKMSQTQRDSLFIIPGKEMVPSQEKRQELFMNFTTTDDHLMHIIGTAIDQNGSEYYLVKNSWGDKRAFEGLVYVSKSYMAMKTIGIMIHKDAVPKSISKQIN